MVHAPRVIEAGLAGGATKANKMNTTRKPKSIISRLTYTRYKECSLFSLGGIGLPTPAATLRGV